MGDIGKIKRVLEVVPTQTQDLHRDGECPFCAEGRQQAAIPEVKDVTHG